MAYNTVETNNDIQKLDFFLSCFCFRKNSIYVHALMEQISSEIMTSR